MSAPRQVRIVVCDDSPTYAEALRRLLELDRDLHVVAVCPSAERLLELLPALAPDLVIVDVELPGMGGIEAVRHIMTRHPTPIVVLSAHAARGSRAAAAALGAGALEALPKSELSLRRSQAPAAMAFRRRMKRLAQARAARLPARRPPEAPIEAAVHGRRAGVVGVCSSAGGPSALRAVLAALPRGFPLPILVVQHMAPGFIQGLAAWLGDSIELPVRLAVDGARAATGVWIAPDDAHLVLAGDWRLRLLPEPSAVAHRPAGDVLLRSLATTAGALSVAVVLTGMGRDGADGTAAVRAAGGLTIAQDAETSAIYGMPRAAAERGVELVLPLHEIGNRLTTLKARAS